MSGINLAGNLTMGSNRSAAALTANQIADTILKALVRTRTRFRLTAEKPNALDEGIRWIRQHEDVIAHVIPDLRRRLDGVQVPLDQ
jgi:hypothetical protein